MRVCTLTGPQICTKETWHDTAWVISRLSPVFNQYGEFRGTQLQRVHLSAFPKLYKTILEKADSFVVPMPILLKSGGE